MTESVHHIDYTGTVCLSGLLLLLIYCWPGLEYYGLNFKINLI